MTPNDWTTKDMQNVFLDYIINIIKKKTDEKERKKRRQSSIQ